MNPATSPIQHLLTAMLIVAMPFCCCRGQSVVAFLGGGHGCMMIASDGAESSHPDDGHVHLATSGDGSGGSGCSGEGTSHDHGDEPCDCSHQSDVKNMPSATLLSGFGLNAPPALAAFSEDLQNTGLVSLHKRWRIAPGALLQEPTSLLRQHCALIV